MNERALSYLLAMNLACYAMLLTRLGVRDPTLHATASRGALEA